MTDPISCTLAENALDYLILAGEQANEGSSRYLKHAVATLADGVELLIKARLEAEAWQQLFIKPEDATRDRFERGEFRSVSFDDAVERLGELCSVTLTTSHAAILDSLRQQRNRIRHFAITTDRVTATSLVTKTFSFALDFVAKEIEPNHPADLSVEVDQLRKMLTESQDFVDQRMSEIQEQMDAQKHCPFVDCPTCLQITFYSDGESAKCLFCSHETDGEHAADEWADRLCGSMSPKEMATEPVVKQCPECELEACIPAGIVSTCNVEYVCLACGESGDYEHCSACGRLSAALNPGDHCDDCWEDVLRRND